MPNKLTPRETADRFFTLLELGDQQEVEEIKEGEYTTYHNYLELLDANDAKSILSLATGLISAMLNREFVKFWINSQLASEEFKAMLERVFDGGDSL